MSLGCCLLLDKAGRRPLLLGSAGAMGVASAALAASFALPPGGAANALALSGALCFITAFSIGFGPIPWLASAWLSHDACTVSSC